MESAPWLRATAAHAEDQCGWQHPPTSGSSHRLQPQLQRVWGTRLVLAGNLAHVHIYTHIKHIVENKVNLKKRKQSAGIAIPLV